MRYSARQKLIALESYEVHAKTMNEFQAARMTAAELVQTHGWHEAHTNAKMIQRFKKSDVPANER